VTANPDTPEFIYVPKTLLAAIWIQTALSYVEPRRYGRCQTCGRWFEVSASATGKRPDAETCGNVCKRRRIRTRKRDAIRLFREGRTLRDVSVATGADPRALSRWKKAAAEPVGKPGRPRKKRDPK
jgi:hypothetical protein